VGWELGRRRGAGSVVLLIHSQPPVSYDYVFVDYKIHELRPSSSVRRQFSRHVAAGLQKELSYPPRVVVLRLPRCTGQQHNSVSLYTEL